MALKQTAQDVAHFFHSDSPSPHGDTSKSTGSTPRPTNFLEKPKESDVIPDPQKEGVVFLPHQAPSGWLLRHESGNVTEYTDYSISHLEAELNSKHLPKKYRCRYCVYKTSYKSDLNRHLRKHGIALQHCPVCRMPFKTIGNLENHLTLLHPHLVQNMGSVSPAHSLKGVFTPAGSAPSSPEMAGSHIGSSQVAISGIDSGHGEQSVRDFAALPQPLYSPHHLHCHMCPFSSNDAQILARHILTHPGEEEASRAPQSSLQNTSLPGLTCSVCDLTVPSSGDFQTHGYFCTDSYPGQHRKRVWTPDNPTKSINNGGTDVGNEICFPQRETISKLRRALTCEDVSSVYQTISFSSSSSSAGQISSSKKRKISMLLPHIPVQMNSADQRQPESAYRPTTRPSPVADTHHGGESHVMESAFRRSVSRESSYNPVSISDVTYTPPLSALAPRLTSVEQGQAHSSRNIPQTFDSADHSESTAQNKGRNTGFSSESVGRRLQPASASLTEMDRRSQSGIDQPKNMSINKKRTPQSLNSRTSSCKPSERETEENSDQRLTGEIKEEPLSPATSADLEKSQRTRKTCLGTRRSQMNPKFPRSDTSGHECRLCGQLFRDSAHLIQHLQHVHILATEPAFTSIRNPTYRGDPTQPQRLTTLGIARVPENSCLVPKSQDRLHLDHVPRDKDVSQESLQNHFLQRRVVSKQPSHGRYAVLVSNFDDFASRPYACALCFFRTAQLAKLSQHVHYHLTGGNPMHESHTACFQSKIPFLVERGVSPFKAGSEEGLSSEPTAASDSASSSAIGSCFENPSEVTISTDQSQRSSQLGTRHTAGQSAGISSAGDMRQTQCGDVDEQALAPINVSTVAASNSSFMPATQSARSALQPRADNNSSCSPEVRLVPAAMTSAKDVHTTSVDCDPESKQPSEGCSDILKDSGYRPQARPVQADAQDSINTPTGLAASKKNTLLRDGSEETQQILKQSPMITVPENSAARTPNPKISAGKSERSQLQSLYLSSRKLSGKKSWMDGFNSRWRCCRRLKSRTRVLRKSGIAEKGYRWNAGNTQMYSCGQCTQSFYRKEILTRHARFVHRGSGSVNK